MAVNVGASAVWITAIGAAVTAITDLIYAIADGDPATRPDVGTAVSMVLIATTAVLQQIRKKDKPPKKKAPHAPGKSNK